MKKGQEIEGKIVRMDYPNKGIMQTEEGSVRINNALPGQTVRCTIKRAGHGRMEGNLREVIAPATDEIEALCPHAGRCGGCLYQTFPYEKELEIKEDQIRRLLDPVIKTQGQDYDFEPIVSSEHYERYRNKMEFTFGDEYKGGPLALGMHRRGSLYDIETVTSCRITDEDYSKIISITLDYFGSREIPFYHRLTHVGYLRHLLVRRTAHTGEIMVAIVTSSQEPWASVELIDGYKEALLALEDKANDEKALNGRIAGIIHILNDSVADAVKADEIRVCYGDDFITEKLLGLEFKITPFSFFQTNTYGAEVLYKKVQEYAQLCPEAVGGNIYDLYSGTGTITQIIGQTSRHATGVEIVAEAVEAAKENAKRNGLHNCDFIAGDVLKVLDDLTEKPDMIILDPPRDGIHPKALPKILSYGVKHMIYVSCKATSLARDLEEFINAGYVVEKVCPVDQFPRTGNIETIALLQKINHNSKTNAYVNVGIDAKEYYAIKNADKE